ncbi:hypothetical protein DFH09DRAFT_1091111 [Mycena vulgaris]|nr:hypothetical protein DFH09DRAFT_1091111 [Mycena vulgaris]
MAIPREMLPNSKVDSYIFRALEKFPSQWYHLDLDVPPADFAHLAEIRGPLSMLRKVTIASPLESTVHWDNAPELSELRILYETPETRVAWRIAGLRRLQIDEVIGFSTLMEIFRKCPRLLHLDVSVEEADENQTRSSCSLDHLGLLKIYTDDSVQILSRLELEYDRNPNAERGVNPDPNYALLKRPDILLNLTTLKISEPGPRWRYDFAVEVLTARMEHNSCLRTGKTTISWAFIDTSNRSFPVGFMCDSSTCQTWTWSWTEVMDRPIVNDLLMKYFTDNGYIREKEDYVLIPDIGPK